MAKSLDAPKSSRGTDAYSGVLHRLGIDIEMRSLLCNRGDVMNLNEYEWLVEYPNLRTDDQLQALADQHAK